MKRVLAVMLALVGLGFASFRSLEAMTTAEQYGWYYDDGSSGTTGGGGPDDPKCGTGTRTECSRTVVQKCTQWVTTNVNGGVTVGTSNGGTVGASSTCGTWVTTTTIKYYP